MITVARHRFRPVGFAHPYTTVPISDLVNALVSRCLGFKWQPARATGKGRPAMAAPVRDALIACYKIIIPDLSDGKLSAYALVGSSGQFREIAPDYWKNELCGFALDGVMFDLDEGKTFSGEVNGSDVYVLGEDAKTWLIRQGISGIDPFCPPSLRLKRKTTASRKTQYNWLQFENEVVCRLRLYRNRSLDPTEADLMKEMNNWCSLTWDRRPDPKMVRMHLRIAYDRFQEEEEEEARNLRI